jgi:hypothetical protein
VDDEQLRPWPVANDAVTCELGQPVPPLGRQLLEAAAADFDDQ